MIGGGEIGSFLASSKNLDQELIVRYAQSQALMPMMQFSVAPWRVLDNVHLKAIKIALTVRNKFVSYILSLSKEASISGEPIIRPLEYVFPWQGYSEEKKMFMLGDKVLVAPVMEKGIDNITIQLPRVKSGNWKSDDGKIYKSGEKINIAITLNRLPYFELVK
jgi:alpha-glucosidase (family GH31 glycosyl hydrolase)